jgi:hypothetical protein
VVPVHPEDRADSFPDRRLEHDAVVPTILRYSVLIPEQPAGQIRALGPRARRQGDEMDRA